METVKHKVDFCVVGGGMAGMCAAIEAARHGVKTLLMHERPVLGGNASSEIRMWICGAPYRLETGIIEEIRLENMYRNTTPNYSVWDSILYEKARFQKNLTLLLNCSCEDAVTENGRIKSVKGYRQTTQSFHEVEADFFADCSGDSVLAPLSGADFRIGREAKSEFGESLAQDKPDSKTMGMSCLIQAREYDCPKTFIPPAWANKYPDEKSLPPRMHNIDLPYQNFWWLELGGDRDSIRDTEEVRDELLKTAFGLWDHIKNHGDHGAENWALEWVGFLPGKRESRRYMGDYILKEKDVLENTYFEDAAAYGGWPVDDHHPAGFNHFGEANINIVPEQPYTIPMRSLYSRNVSNLMFAGRNISSTHTAISSARVMATCALTGQAVGAVVFHAKKKFLSIRDTVKKHYKDVQRTLLDDDCHIPGLLRSISELSRGAALEGTGSGISNLRLGADRALDGKDNAWICKEGDYAEYSFAGVQKIKSARIVFDSDLERTGRNLGHLNMPANYPLAQEESTPPKTLVKAYHIEADSKTVFYEKNNYQRFVKIPLDLEAGKVRLVIDETRSPGEKRVFGFELD